MAKYGFSATFGKGEVHNTFAEYALRIHRAIETVMQFIGEECVRIAREQGTYNDITGNLRNSVGYVLVRNGDIICKNFEERVASKVIDAANGKGILQGQALAEELAIAFYIVFLGDVAILIVPLGFAGFGVNTCIFHHVEFRSIMAYGVG